ncbi:transcription elongation factor GreA [Candidatus Deferrimicrobium sp.]|uniref:GreA/GreB family elongation factor n=1 Tax=Candidatus Deferrimicrobium sp. TaxID=3060586 RepID=UPI002ED0CCC4
MLRDVKQKLEEEMQRIEHELRVSLPKEIQAALGQGDLSENAEYEAAKNRQSTLQARFAQIQKRLADLSRIDVAGVPTDRAGLGSEVTVENLESGEVVRYTLVIPELADGNKSFVSMASPVGKALMNRRVGDTVTITIPRGTLEYEVRRIVTLAGNVLE